VNEVNLAVNDREVSKLTKRNIVLFIIGHTVSLLGTELYAFVLSLYILEVTGSALKFSVTFALGMLPRIIFGPIAGVVADKLDRKKLVVFLDMLSAVVVFSLLALSILDEIRLVYIYTTTFLLAVCNAFFYTALTSSIPMFTDDEGVLKANSLGQFASSFASMSGPFIGGILLGLLDIKLFLLINAISFLLSAISEMFIDFNVRDKIYGTSKKTSESKKSTFWKDMSEGFRFLISQKWMLKLYSFILLFNSLIIIGLYVALPYITKQSWGFTSQQFGILNTMYPLGILIASISYSFIPAAQSNIKRIVRSLSIMSTCILIIGIIASKKFFLLSNWQYVFILGGLSFIVSFSETLVNIPVAVIIQRLVPNEKLGRVQGIIGTFALGLVPISFVLGGLIVDIMQPWVLPIVCGVIMILLTFLMSTIQELRKI